YYNWLYTTVKWQMLRINYILRRFYVLFDLLTLQMSAADWLCVGNLPKNIKYMNQNICRIIYKLIQIEWFMFVFIKYSIEAIVFFLLFVHTINGIIIQMKIDTQQEKSKQIRTNKVHNHMIYIRILLLLSLPNSPPFPFGEKKILKDFSNIGPVLILLFFLGYTYLKVFTTQIPRPVACRQENKISRGYDGLMR
ncbi:hypothetical protein L9F63_000696, partial [Diploptera punctata]